MSLKTKLYETIKRDGMCRIDDLRHFTEDSGFIQSNCERRLRELRDAGLIEKIMAHGAVVGYKIPEKKEQGKLLDIKPKLKSNYEKNYQ